MQTRVLLTAPPDSIEGVFADKYFRQELQSEIKRVAALTRQVRLRGYEAKRTPYDTLREKSLLNERGIIEEYAKIMRKTSKLPSNCRNAVSYIVAKSIREMYNTYNRINSRIINHK
jgi:hypothetical protein